MAQINRKIEYCNVKWINDALFQGIVAGKSKVVESLGTEIKTGGYTCYGVLHEQTLEHKRIARRNRIKKQVASLQREGIDGKATTAGLKISD